MNVKSEEPESSAAIVTGVNVTFVKKLKFVELENKRKTLEI